MYNIFKSYLAFSLLLVFLNKENAGSNFWEKFLPLSKGKRPCTVTGTQLLFPIQGGKGCKTEHLKKN